ncbi:MAG TPA: cytochrome c [Rhizobiales bacterium]|nr:cytochrome c [Hyphomicrobiales bacterium]
MIPGLLAAAILFAAPASAADSTQRGHKLAQKLCARCHAIGKTGASPNTKAPPFRTFEKMWPLNSLEEALGEGIVTGHNTMPEFELEPDQIGDLLTYIASLNK